ncbi:MAG TPA: hypothetical protein VFX45_10000 [Solirubrobacterales bacterium]|nr:hypothetical protein [Solirubrobacterales bacterium]
MEWNPNEARIVRLDERIERIERERREEKDRKFQLWNRVMLSIIWLELAAIWAFSIVKAAGL